MSKQTKAQLNLAEIEIERLKEKLTEIGNHCRHATEHAKKQLDAEGNSSFRKGFYEGQKSECERIINYFNL